MQLHDFKYFILFILMIGTATDLDSQINNRNSKIVVVDFETKESLAGATFYNLTTGKGIATNEKGEAIIVQTNDEDIIEISFLGFLKERITYVSLPDTVYMKRAFNKIDDITITINKPKALTDKVETICDFVIEENNILTLSQIGSKRHVLNLLDLDGKLISHLELPDVNRINSLYTSCLGTHFLIGLSEVLELNISANQIAIIDRVSRSKFDAIILPCKTQNEKYIYIEKKQVKNQIATLIACPRDGSEPFVFGQIADHENLARYSGEVAYLNYADGVGPVYLGIHAEKASDAIQYGDMLNRSFYLPVDYFIMDHENAILLFDHEKHKLNILTEEGELIEDYNIDYHLQDGWNSKKNLFYDEQLKKLYAVIKKNGSNQVSEINLKNGSSQKVFVFEASFIDKLIIHNNALFFTNSSVVQNSRILNRIRF